jgi:hypothetical protein
LLYFKQQKLIFQGLISPITKLKFHAQLTKDPEYLRIDKSRLSGGLKMQQTSFVSTINSRGHLNILNAIFGAS